MELYLKLIDVLFPVFFIIGIGYYIGKTDPKFNTKFITNFAGTIGTPAMIFYTITTTGVTLDIFIQYFIYAVIILGVLLLSVSFFVVFKKRSCNRASSLVFTKYWQHGRTNLFICLWNCWFRSCFSNRISYNFISLHHRRFLS